MTTLVRVSELKKNYQTGDVNFEALRGISLEIAAGDFVAVMGQSGSGKSTLLHIIGGLDQSSSGWVQVGEHRLDEMNQTDLAIFRRDQVGFIFQFFNLVENLNVQACRVPYSYPVQK
jgi:putative ABC transport system ATP-binding protein